MVCETHTRRRRIKSMSCVYMLLIPTPVTYTHVVGVKLLNQSHSSDFRVKAAVQQHTLAARHPGDELPYICQYAGTTRFSVEKCKTSISQSIYFV